MLFRQVFARFLRGGTLLDSGGRKLYVAPAFGLIWPNGGVFERMQNDTNSPSPPEDFDARLRAAKAREDVETRRTKPSQGAAGAGMGIGFRVAVDMMSCLGVGAAVGYGLDQVCGTRPWLMVVFLLLGATAGVLDVYRVAKRLDSSIGLGQAQRRRDDDTPRNG